MNRLRLFQAASCVNIVIGRDSVTSVHVRGNNKSEPVWSKTLSTEDRFFGSETYTVLESALGAVLAEVRRRVRRTFTPIQVMLPDPVVNAAVFELEELPGRQRAVSDLVRWRFSDLLGVGANDMAVTHQDLGEESGAHLLFGLALRQDLLDALQSSFDSAGLMVSVIDMAACYRHNGLHSRFAPGSGAFFYLDADYWTLSVWDEQQRIRHLRSRWRGSAADDTQALQGLFPELMRTLLAYEQGGSGRQIEHFYGMSNDQDFKGLSSGLAEAGYRDCQRLRFGSRGQYDWDMRAVSALVGGCH